MKTIYYHRNPGLKPPKRISTKLRQDIDSFIESESVDREARAIELANLYGINVHEILSEITRKKKA